MADGIQEKKVAGGEEADGRNRPAHDVLIDAAAEVRADVAAETGEHGHLQAEGPLHAAGDEKPREAQRRKKMGGYTPL